MRRPHTSVAAVLAIFGACAVSAPGAARADDTANGAAPAAPASTAVPTGPAGPPAPPPPPLQTGQHFTVDPILDGVLTVSGLGVSGLLGLVLTTGEIKPQAASPGDEDKLLSFDRYPVDLVLQGKTDPNAGTYSTIGLWAAVGFAGLDSLLSGFRDGVDAGLVDAMLYTESLSLALTLNDITKIAVRRPRPIDYAAGSNPQVTDYAMSFYSGHVTIVAAVTATATYLAFVRSPHSARPWITLAIGTLLTAAVGYWRVTSGEHFPTDVVAGAGAGGAIGILVPHLHRHPEEAPKVYVGAAPMGTNGGGLTLGGLF